MFFIFSLFAVSCVASCVIIVARIYRLAGEHSHHQPNVFSLLDDFTDGVFLGIGVFDLLPHALELSGTLGVTRIMIVAAVATGVMILCAINYLYRSAIKHKNAQHDGVCCAHELRPSVFMYSPILVLLAVHSLFEGVALGIINEPLYQWILFTSIALHKGLESIAFANAALSAFTSKILAYGCIIIFATLTPIGVYAGGVLMQFHPHHDIIAGLLTILSASMFIYMGLSCVLLSGHHTASSYMRPSLFGLCLVAVVSMLSHQHHEHDHNNAVDINR